jgi:hypothetical protein
MVSREEGRNRRGMEHVLVIWELHIEFSSKNLKERDHSGDIGVDIRILKGHTI